jgi:hypothetical protein
MATLFFGDPAANRIYKSDADRKATLFTDNSKGTRALRKVQTDGASCLAAPAVRKADRRVPCHGSGMGWETSQAFLATARKKNAPTNGAMAA